MESILIGICIQITEANLVFNKMKYICKKRRQIQIRVVVHLRNMFHIIIISILVISHLNRHNALDCYQ